MYFLTGLESAGRISYEFAYQQLGDPGSAVMYNYISMKCMQPAASTAASVSTGSMCVCTRM